MESRPSKDLSKKVEEEAGTRASRDVKWLGLRT